MTPARDDLYVAREGDAYALYSRTTRCAIVYGRKRSLDALLRRLIEQEQEPRSMKGV